MSKLILAEYSSPNYAERTKLNAFNADYTLAIASYFNTAGELLTKRFSSNYIHFYLNKLGVEASRVLYKFVKSNGFKKVNIAGNSMATFAQNGYTQEQINRKLYDLLKPIHEHIGIEHIRSGGQSGMDLAGGVVAVALGIDCEMLFPKGFKQRGEDGKDFANTEDEIRDNVMMYVNKLKEELL